MPDEPDSMDELIDEAAAEPKSASGDSGSMQQRDLRELIEADRYRKSKSVSTGVPVRYFKFVPPGTA